MVAFDGASPQEVIDKLFVGKDAPYGPYTCVKTPEPIGDRMLWATLQRPGDESDLFDVLLFGNIFGVAGELWEHEVRNLLRLQAIGHPALPEIVDGGLDAGLGVAFTMTRQTGTRLSEVWTRDDFPQWVRDNRGLAFEQYSLLVDALSQLHGARILHRNLTPGAITIRQAGENRYAFALGRFEMSALLGNLVRTLYAPSRNEEYRTLMKALYLEPPAGIERAHHLAYLAPETWPSIFDEVPEPRRDWTSTDVFGLGVFGWELFCGPLAETLPEAYTAVSAAGPGELLGALGALHTTMRRHLQIQSGRAVPRELARVLLGMLDPEPGARHSSFEAARSLEEHWGSICDLWESIDPERQPYLVAFMPAESVDTVYRQRQWIAHSPEEATGRDELRDFLTWELRQAELVWSPGGAKGFVAGPEERLQQAEWALIGEQAVWFCAFLYDETLSGRIRTKHTRTLVIKYLVDRRFAQEILAARPRRRIGRIDLVAYRARQDLSSHFKDRPDWTPLTEAVKAGRTAHDPGNQQLLRSMEFMLEYQGVMQRARQYPYVRVAEGSSGRTHVLQIDRDRDLDYRHSNPLLTAFAGDPRLRAPLGDFAASLLGEQAEKAGEVVLDIVAGDGTPYFGRDRVHVTLVARKDADTVEVHAPDVRQFPAVGWLRPAQDRGTAIQLSRMARGVEALRQKSGLMRSLHSPSSITLNRSQWSPDTSDEGPQLTGKGEKIVGKMLETHPFFALQGPPGTGKTTVATHAVQRYLRAEPGARILVSAQSNGALDHLGLRLVEQLRTELADRRVLLLREIPDSRGAGSLPPALQPYTLTRLSESLRDTIREATRRMALTGPDGAGLDRAELRLAQEWSDLVENNLLEVSDRIKAGANIVLATCSIAGTLSEEIRDASDIFDWVLIEEAAKAWPTEIIMPLVLGVRWTLIGDHRQLGPHRATDVRNFLETLRESGNPQLARHVEMADKYLAHLELFGTLFENNQQHQQPNSPLDKLDQQFRMHPDIAEPVARAFYQQRDENNEVKYDSTGLPETFLTTPATGHAKRHGLTAPPYVAGSPLVWLDTSHRRDCADKPYWRNEGEARLVTELVGQLAGTADSDSLDFAVLTPYVQQVNALKQFGNLRGRVHTVHSFQGQEADLVIVSLVRSTVQGPDVRQNVGHVAQAELVNVLLSRARKLLVVVGDLPHFEEHGGEAWKHVTTVFRRIGKIKDAAAQEPLG
ncbi:AAA domain-containing protein [Kitasatospora aureofaciens]|uniref:AAA domain-containing protein n=1 Tax=Kitasatospora aureofaciens TaxID=1894 RepID=UPI0033A06745